MVVAVESSVSDVGVINPGKDETATKIESNGADSIQSLQINQEKPSLFNCFVVNLIYAFGRGLK